MSDKDERELVGSLDGSQKYKPKKEEVYRPIDQWEEEEYPELSKDIECHIDNYIEDAHDKYYLKRLIFMSIRERIGKK